MAEATDRHVGNDELVRVSATAPTLPADPDDAAYKLLGLQTSFNYQVQGQSVDIRDKIGASTKYGSNTRTATMGVNTSLAGDDAQTIMTNAAESEGANKSLVYFNVSSGVAGDRVRSGTFYVGGLNDQSPTDAAATIEYTVAVNGVPATGVIS